MYACTYENSSVWFSGRKRGRPHKSVKKNPTSAATVTETMLFTEQSKMYRNMFELFLGIYTPLLYNDTVKVFIFCTVLILEV